MPLVCITHLKNNIFLLIFSRAIYTHLCTIYICCKLSTTLFEKKFKKIKFTQLFPLYIINTKWARNNKCID